VPLIATANAPRSGLIPCHASVEASRYDSINADTLHRAVHELGMVKDPL
jgi:hypothetical protein